MERRSSNRFVSCLVVVCLVCLHWFCFMFCVACPRKEGFESLGCPFSHFQAILKMRQDRSFKSLCSGFSFLKLGFQLVTKAWRRHALWPPTAESAHRTSRWCLAFWMFGFLQQTWHFSDFTPWNHKGPALVTGIDTPPELPLYCWCHRLVALSEPLSLSCWNTGCLTHGTNAMCSGL